MANRTQRHLAVATAAPLQLRTAQQNPALPRRDTQNVIAFPARAVATRTAEGLEGWVADRASNVVDLQRHRTALSNASGGFGGARIGQPEASAQGDVDYSHRMFVNLLAAAASVLLIVAGEWIFSTLAKIP